MAQTDLASAISRAQDVIFSMQLEDGSWDDSCDAGPGATAQVLIALRYLNALDDEAWDACIEGFRSIQFEDGSFPAYPTSDVGDVTATATCLAAIRFCGATEDDSMCSRAANFVEMNGGYEAALSWMLAAGNPAALYLSLAGLLDSELLPEIPLFLLTFKPVTQWLEKRFNAGVMMTLLQMEAIQNNLLGHEGLASGSRVRRRLSNHLINYQSPWQNPAGHWNSNIVQTALAVMAYRAIGLPLDDDRLRRGIEWLKAQLVIEPNGGRYRVFGANVRSTAYCLRALLDSGSSRQEEAVAKGLGWLVDAQIHSRPPVSGPEKPRHAAAHAGWAMQKDNANMPGSADVGGVLSVFGQALRRDEGDLLPDAVDERIRESRRLGAEWVLSMQNPDGGWPAYIWGMPSMKAGPLMHTPQSTPQTISEMLEFMISPPVELGEPSTADLTAGVLHGMAMIGYDTHTSIVTRGLNFLKERQLEDGSWWGRWTCNYLAATASVVMAAAALGLDISENWIAKAVDFLVHAQNSDGGWGETEKSYEKPELGGKGPSMPPLTGLVVGALIDAGIPDSISVSRGIDYLLTQQRTDGSWPNADWIQPLLPPTSYYLYPAGARFYPLMALGRYRRWLERDDNERLPIKHSLSTPAYDLTDLSAWRNYMDPAADEIVEQLYATGQIKAVNQVFKELIRCDDPIPDNIPDAARQYFYATEALPDWADMDQIELAQRLFSKAGWGIVISLYCSALPQAYAARNGAAVLIQTQALSHHIRRRLLETAQFVFDVTEEGGFSASGRAVRSVQKVRLMHAAVRKLILDRKQWQMDWGAPINQEDLVGAQLTFSVVILDGLDRLKIKYSAEEGEAWMHLWRVVGYMMGIQDHLLPKTRADATAMAGQIRQTQWVPSNEGRALTKALLDFLEEDIPGTMFDKIPPALIRYLAGDYCADILGLGQPGWNRVLVDFAVDLTSSIRFESHDTYLERIFHKFSISVLHSIANLYREGKDVYFRVPPGLIRDWE